MKALCAKTDSDLVLHAEDVGKYSGDLDDRTGR